MNDYERKKRRDDQGKGWRDDPICKYFYCARRCLLCLRGGFVVDPMVPSTDPTVVLLASDGVFARSPTVACMVKQQLLPELRLWKGTLQVVPREPVVLGDAISMAGWKMLHHRQGLGCPHQRCGEWWLLRLYHRWALSQW